MAITKFFVFLLGSLLALGGSLAMAQTTLSPGGVAGGTGGAFTSANGLTFQASETGAFNTPGGVHIYFAEAVFTDSNNSGKLDFFYQFDNLPTSSDGLTSTAALFFNNGGPYTIAVGAYAGAFNDVNMLGKGFLASSGTGAVPVSTALAGNSSTITWSYPATKQFIPGDVTPIFEIQTSASAYDTNGIVSALDGGSQNYSPSFEPVPEPSMISGLAGLVAMGGLSGLGLVWRRKR
jgi:hypothetical protein